jgi:curved DNA-binding protein CbpA
LENTTDYYSLLGIERSAGASEIKQAYRRMVFRYHPDRNPDDDQAADMFKQILEAYETLSDSEKRSTYDEVTRPAEEPEKEDADQKEQFGDNINQGFRFTHEFKNKVEPEPKCPKCSAAGVDHIVSRKGGSASSRGKQFVLAPFNVIFCNQCGHVYGVTANFS